MNSDGWIPKEQARGQEAQFGIPVEYLGVEKNLVVPPMMIIVLKELLKSENDLVKSTLAEIYKGLEAHY
jgi:hypothetical protein